MWWHTYPVRFQTEVAQIRRYYPAALIGLEKKVPVRFCPACAHLPPHGTALGVDYQPHLAVIARVVTAQEHIFPIILVYPCEFPHRLPGVWPLERLFPRPPSHQFADGRLCLTDTESNPALTGAILLTWAHEWLSCYDTWRTTGIFPSGSPGG